MKAIPNPGTYPAKTAGQMVAYESDSGAFCVAVPVELLASEVMWRGKHTVTLFKKDGAPNQKSIDTMKKVYGWDGVNPFDLEDMDTSSVEFEIVGEHEAYTPPGDDAIEVTVFKVQWLNPVGGSTSMPEKIERKTALAKWGSKFKALAGGGAAVKPAATKTAATPAKTAAPAKAPAKPAASGPPGRKANDTQLRTSSQEEVWNALVKKNPDEAEDALGARYYEAQDEVAPSANGDLTPAQWGEVATKLEV